MYAAPRASCAEDRWYSRKLRQLFPGCEKQNASLVGMTKAGEIVAEKQMPRF